MFESEEPIGQRLARLRPLYISVFLVQAFAMGAVITWREAATGGHSSVFDLLIAVVLKMDNVSYLAIITSVLIVDFGRLMVGLLIKAPQDRAREQGLARGREQGLARGREQGREEGREEGAAAERQRWMDYGQRMQAWRQRYLDAQERDEPFDEPPPRTP